MNRYERTVLRAPAVRIAQLVTFLLAKLHRLEPTYTSKMDIYAYLLYSDKSDYDKLSTLERLANDMHQTSINTPETWTVIGYYSLKKKSQKAKCFAENVKTVALDRWLPIPVF